VAAWSGLVLLYLSPVHAQTWDSIRTLVRRKFPEVRQISTAELAAWLADTNRSAPVLIDARSPDEFAVSHLPGARRADDPATVRTLAPSPGEPVVIYCSVGYRSAALAERLRRAGYERVFNLDGSIFAWANEGRPVHRDGRPLAPARVHPYDRKWGRLLDARYHAWK